MANTKTILLTIDVEDWFQVENLRPWFPTSTWHNQATRVEYNTTRLLNLFDTFNRPIHATFFVLGWIAEKFPSLIREIRTRGHEVASHGHNHLLCNQMGQKQLIHDLKKSKKILEDLTGIQVKGYRAPSFTISDQVLSLLVDCGYKYDSSYNSFDRHGRYGTITNNGHPEHRGAIKVTDQMVELPISNIKLFNQTIPWGGGGYFRLMPLPIFIKGISRILDQTGAYIFYMHPWEIDPHQPKVKEAKGSSSWRHYLNLDKTYGRLKRMISHFQDCNFLTCSEYLDTVFEMPAQGKKLATDPHRHTRKSLNTKNDTPDTGKQQSKSGKNNKPTSV